ncbi:hypothetical protein FQA39_LY03717 [Lamprigera yunnana]|nr:hypothetical protein FQA39_LY03717 [Lamprigera yunnana]
MFLLYDSANGSILEYVQSVGAYFGYGKGKPEESLKENLYSSVVPYEVSVSDEKFISEAIQLTGVTPSELDFCQHRVVLKLQTSCDKMNDEELAKMAVMLLNCQSAVEGRKVYPCSETMSIKDCTVNMDPDTWNSYHLMSNRARAVCYIIRQTQFRGLTEYTINKLMSAAQDQLVNLNKISVDQKNLHSIATNFFNFVSEGQDFIAKQQKDFQQAQLRNQLTLENNIQRLVHEKQLIVETNEDLMKMAQSVHHKMEEASNQLEGHTQESHANHKQLLDDLIAIQNKAHIIFQKMEDSSRMLLEQNKLAHLQYNETLKKLAEVNETIHLLVTLVSTGRKTLEEQILWVKQSLGGTDLTIERISIWLSHIVSLLMAMIGCAFLNTPKIVRAIVITTIPINLGLTLHQSVYTLQPLNLCIGICLCIVVDLLICSIMRIDKFRMLSSSDRTSKKTSPVSSYEYDDDEDEDRKSTFDAGSLQFRKPITCLAVTRLGTPCKNTLEMETIVIDINMVILFMASSQKPNNGSMSFYVILEYQYINNGL